VIHRGRPFEVATFRSDEAYVDGRRPTGVVFTDAQTDVLRRDFTINGLLYDPIEDRVIDYVSGQADIRDRIVRAIGNPEKRFEEDKLRLLRAVRFGARLGYSIEPETWAAVCRMAPEIKRVSAERIREELGRILTEGSAALGFRMLHESGLLAAILPAVRWSEQLERSLDLIPAKAPMDFAFAVLLHDVPLDAVQQITQDLKLSASEAKHVVALVKSLPGFAKLRGLSISELKRFLRLPRFEDHMELARISATAARGDLDDWNFATTMLRKWSSDEIAPPHLISGDDLIQRAGPELCPGELRAMKILAVLLLVLNLNTATPKQLEALPGIGPALAKKIVDFREKKGRFKRVEELLAIPGISEKKWKVLRDHLKVE
jgi:competence ComEA-like helix-hairpin-helix protein